MTHHHATIPSRPSLARRQFIKGATALASAPFWRDAAAARTPPARSPDLPVFFTSDEFHFVESASECILPHDENGPGAQELGVAGFIDQQMQTPYGHGELWYRKPPFVSGPPELGYQLPYTPRQLYRNGIYSLTQQCLRHYHAPFHQLPQNTQQLVLSHLETGALTLEDIPGPTFFEQLRNNTLEGAFSDPIYGGNRDMKGWIMMGFPGARADFMDWINQNGAPYPFGPVSISPSLSMTIRE